RDRERFPLPSPLILLEKMGVSSHASVINEFEALTKDAGRIQRETLREILEQNGEAEYLHNFGLGGRTDPDSFKSCIPLVTHSDLEPYIQRIADGDTSPVLTGKPITSISLSSGTTQGKPKLLPFNDALIHSTMQIYRTSFAFRNREYPIGNGKALQFIYSSKQAKTKGGLTATTATTNVYRSEQFKHTMEDIRSQCCSPNEVIFGPDFQQSLYCHLLCGLIYSDEVQIVSSTFAHSLVHAFRTFERVWEELCTDLSEGVLSSRITVPSIRAAVSKLLNPNPGLADSIHSKCSRLSNWYGVIPALWPNAKYVYGIMTGSMEPYLNKLRHYAGSLPLMSADYGSSEGWIGANVNPSLPPELATFAVLPNIGYYEFIPLEKPEGTGTETEKGTAATIHYVEAQPVGLTQVEVGKQYEVVVTNFTGNRYLFARSFPRGLRVCGSESPMFSAALTNRCGSCDRLISIQAGRHREDSRVSQLHTGAPIRMQKKPNAEHQHRQEHREGSAVGGGSSSQAAGGGKAGGGGLHKPRRHIDGDRPLRGLLGAVLRR
ncbi:unnamed protein product, partial [Musa banksii]